MLPIRLHTTSKITFKKIAFACIHKKIIWDAHKLSLAYILSKEPPDQIMCLWSDSTLLNNLLM